MESAEMISPFTAFAREMERLVFPTAVGPVSTINGFFITYSYTIRLNFFSISVFVMEMMVGLPCGQWYGFSSVISSSKSFSASSIERRLFPLTAALHAIVASLDAKISSASLLLVAVQMIQHLKEKFFFGETVKIGWHGTDAVFTAAEMFDLKAKLFKVTLCLRLRLPLPAY